MDKYTFIFQHNYRLCHSAIFFAISDFADACKIEKFWLFFQPHFGRVLELIIGRKSVHGGVASNLETVLGRMSALTSSQTNATDFSSFYCLLFVWNKVQLSWDGNHLVGGQGCLKEQSELFYFTGNKKSEIAMNCTLTKTVTVLKNKCMLCSSIFLLFKQVKLENFLNALVKQTSYRPGGGETICPPQMAVRLAVDLRRSGDGSAVRNG